MKNTELRIGNLIEVVHIDYGKTQKSVDVGILNEMDDLDEKTTYHEIPLTKEWLMFFGFKTDDYQQEFELDTINLDCEYTDKGEWVLFLKGNNIKPIESKNEYICKYYPKAEIKYVHQLQNLYYALRGEELFLK